MNVSRFDWRNHRPIPGIDFCDLPIGDGIPVLLRTPPHHDPDSAVLALPHLFADEPRLELEERGPSLRVDLPPPFEEFRLDSETQRFNDHLKSPLGLFQLCCSRTVWTLR